MRKAVIAGLITAVSIGTVAGGIATFSASQSDTQLQIAEGSAEETMPETSEDQDKAPVEDAAEDKEQDAEVQNADDQESAAGDEDSEESVTEAAASLPTGNVAKSSLVDEGEENMTGVADVAENVMPAMVAITNTSVRQVEDWFRGGSMQYEYQSAGTGVIMGENEDELLVVTNNHVVEGASELAVTFINESSVAGTVKGTDEENDLAVVAVQLSDIDEETLDQIRIANVADSEDVRIGEQVVAIGNALGYGQSVTTGIVSAMGKEVRVKDNQGVSEYEELIQTDAAINAGNSGGALLNMKGEVIGINSVKASANGVEGMGYAIPTSKAVPIIKRLMNRESRTANTEETAPYLGITGQDVTASVSQLYGLPRGVYLTAVDEGTPASEAGLTEGMIIVGFDGNTIEGMSDLQEQLDYYRAGETVTLTVEVISENGKMEEEEFTLTLGLRSDYIPQTN